MVEASENRNPHDGWVYNKYNDGTAECWYQPLTTLIQTVSWGQGWYYNKTGTSGSFNSYKYPFTWAQTPLIQRWVIQSNAEGNGHAVMVMPYTYGNIEYTGSVFYGSNGSDSSNRSYYDCVYAFGLWK